MKKHAEQQSRPGNIASEENGPETNPGAMQFIASLKNDAITFKPVRFPVAGEKAGRDSLVQIASALLGVPIDPRQIPDEVADLVFIHTPTPHFAVLMPEPSEGLMLGIGSWSALQADVPDVAQGLQRVIQTAMTDGKQH